MTDKNSEFQVFVKPVGARCNLRCTYCYYLEKESLNQNPGNRDRQKQQESKTTDRAFIMSDEILEKFTIQNIAATDGQIVNFSWHGG